LRAKNLDHPNDRSQQAHQGRCRCDGCQGAEVGLHVVRLGSPVAPDNQILHALDQVGLGSEFNEDNAGLDRVVTANNVGVSVGQSQRLALARALLRQTHVLILDEPTAALDSESERAVLVALRHAADGGAIVLVVAHRPAMLEIADQVVRIGESK